MSFLLRLSVFCLVMAGALPAAAAGFAKVGSFAYSWEGIFVSGRLSALGGSDLADGSPASVLVNPAPLFAEDGVGLSYDHADYLGETDLVTYAGAAQWRHWRLNVAVQDFLVDMATERTAYNPEGDGSTTEVRDRATVIGLSYDLASGLLDERFLRWSAGFAWRGYSSSPDEESASVSSFDLGTTLGWRTRYSGGWTGLTGAVSWQNVSNATLSFDGRSASLPSPLRLGLTMETAFRSPGHAGDTFKFLLAFTRATDVGETHRENSSHFGLEGLFFDVLALRYGHSSKFYDGMTSWGIGVRLDGRLLGPFTVAADYGEMSFDSGLLDEKNSIWGVKVRYSF